MNYSVHNFIEITQQTKLRVALVFRASRASRDRRVERVERVELVVSSELSRAVRQA